MSVVSAALRRQRTLAWRTESHAEKGGSWEGGPEEKPYVQQQKWVLIGLLPVLGVRVQE